MRILLVLILGILSVSSSFAADQTITPKSVKSGSAATANQKTYAVKGMHCQPCADSIRTELMKMDSVQDAQVSFKNKTATVTYKQAPTVETEAKMKSQIKTKLDYEIL